MRKAHAILFLLALAGCRSRSAMVETVATSQRHADSVARLVSIAARMLDVESETTVVAMRADSLGRLQVVSKDVRRTVTRATETARKADTARFSSSDGQTDYSNEKTLETQGKRADAALGILAVWTCFALLGVLGVAILIGKWKSRN